MIIKPFDALRPTKEEVERVQCPPYDVVDFNEAKRFAKDPHSFMRVVRPDVIANPQENIYEVAARELDRLIEEGALVHHGKPAFYIYSQTMAGHTQTGLVACVAASEYPERIKRHELTRVEKEKERTEHILKTRAHTGQVFLTYKGIPEVKELVKIENGNLLYEVKSHNPEVTHKIYSIDDPTLIERIQEVFKNIPAFYIADGHHRAAASVRTAHELGNDGEWNYFMATIFPHDELQLMGYHRVVKDLNGMSAGDFIARLEIMGFDITRVSKKVEPAAAHHFGMYLNGYWYELYAHNVDKSDPIKRLDVSILQERILGPILGIDNPRTNSRIDFVGGIYGTETLQSLVNSGKYAVAFALYPTSVEDIMDVADAKLFMPPKSTWFEPKLRSGLLVHKF